jgi:hypothetical protein
LDGRASVGLPSRSANLPPFRCHAGPRKVRPACQGRVVGVEVADKLPAPRGARWPVGLKGDRAMASLVNCERTRGGLIGDRSSGARV